MKKTLSVILGVILMAGVFAPLVEAAEPAPPKSDKQFQITGAGATFPYPLIDTWRVEYNKIYSNVNLNYQSIGSGGGVKQHTEKTVNFGATDAPLTIKERELAPGTLHIPEAIGSVVLAYYIPEVPKSGLKLTGENVADIYLGKIKKWNDPKIQENNPDLKLPDRPILVTRRSDGSGTTYVFTDYLSKVSADWDKQVGKGKSVAWPTGVGAAGNEGVAWATRNTKYAIGYVELAYAKANEMTVAYLQNGDKTAFVEPTFDTVFEGAKAYPVERIPKPEADWSQVSMVLAPGQNSYPIVSFTYLLVYEDLNQAVSNKDMAQTLVHMLYWMITDGQKFSKPLGYVPLPENIQGLDKQGLSRLKYDGEQIWSHTSDSVKSDTTKSDVKSDTKTDDKKKIKKDTKKTEKKSDKKTEKEDTKKVKKPIKKTTTKTITNK
ncbi:phosphate ABC transporter substrate-binding protein PstS [Candidatus Nitrosotenuis aquarius]|uniref:phosphate ABC transporter substrate-binding protein PstS n=1 Tax=Candidatus Nitrosotenuis aquarius TaxID=1846278 RepID=UPI000C1E0544|nr:phosphate ABC transporter substrate-binding protein PstS [Candidatus Nitrosotenuis aquarius]